MTERDTILFSTKMKTMNILIMLLVIAVMGMCAMTVADNESPASQTYEINYADAGNAQQNACRERLFIRKNAL